MNWLLDTMGYEYKFLKSSNQLIVECYNYDDVCVGKIKIILNKAEAEKLIKKLGLFK